MTAIIVGIIFTLTGLWGMARWLPDFLVVLKGFGSISLLIGGVVCLIAGIASFQAGQPDKDLKE